MVVELTPFTGIIARPRVRTRILFTFAVLPPTTGSPFRRQVRGRHGSRQSADLHKVTIAMVTFRPVHHHTDELTIAMVTFPLQPPPVACLAHTPSEQNTPRVDTSPRAPPHSRAADSREIHEGGALARAAPRLVDGPACPQHVSVAEPASRRKTWDDGVGS